MSTSGHMERTRACTVSAPWGAVYRRGQTFSLDIVAGVVCAAGFACAVTGADMPGVWWLTLPLLTWVVYSADHLLDARRTGSGATAPQRRFFRRHESLLAAHALGALVLASVCALAFFPPRLLLPAALLGATIPLYLYAAQRPGPLPKELPAAAIYTLGIWFGPLALTADLNVWVAAVVGLHFGAALLNLMVFSLFEQAADLRDDQTSMVRAWGAAATRWLTTLFTAAGVGLALFALGFGPSRLVPFVLVLLVLIVLPGLMLRKSGYFAVAQRFRLLGDLAFLLMVLPVWNAS